MKVEARINLLAESTNSVKALASITIEECFVVTGIRIIESQKGTLFTGMPSRKTANGDYKDVCFPINAETRAAINDEILRAYFEELGKTQNNINNNYGFSDDLPF